MIRVEKSNDAVNANNSRDTENCILVQFETYHATAQSRKEIHSLKMWRGVVAPLREIKTDPPPKIDGSFVPAC